MDASKISLGICRDWAPSAYLLQRSPDMAGEASVDKRVFDLGCQRQRGCFLGRRIDVTGVDPSEQGIALAKHIIRITA